MEFTYACFLDLEVIVDKGKILTRKLCPKFMMGLYEDYPKK